MAVLVPLGPRFPQLWGARWDPSPAGPELGWEQELNQMELGSCGAASPTAVTPGPADRLPTGSARSITERRGYPQAC